MMEFLVEFDVTVPEGTREAEVRERERAEAAAAAGLARRGHLVRLWKISAASGQSRAVGIYRARSQEELDGLLGALPLSNWMKVTVTPLEPHSNDPIAAPASGAELPRPRSPPFTGSRRRSDSRSRSAKPPRAICGSCL